MNKIKEMIKAWQPDTSSPQNCMMVTLQIERYDMARILALSELFKDHTQQQIISDLLSAALDEAEEALPFTPGKKIVAEDEFGDPVYEDIGLTPRFIELTQKHLEKINAEQTQSSSR
jgi:hypothetical protein